MHAINRRGFLKASARKAAVLSLGGAALAATRPRHVLGANERVVLALIGAGGRGTGVASDFAARADVEIGYVCDLHEGRLAATAARIASRQGRAPKTVKEIRRVLDDRGVDAVIVATPDHWHAPASILACQAKKDVYVEKPPSHNIWEGRKMVEAARKYRRVVQVGTQNRSAPYNLAALDYIRSGKLGTIHLCHVYNLKSGGPFHLPADDPAPEGFDWRAWLGPAPYRPHNTRLFGGGWHKYWAYSGGDLADDGVHQLDLAMMLLGDPDLPVGVHATGGRFAFDDDQEVPDTQVVTYQFDRLVMTLELTGYPSYMQKTPGSIRQGDQFPFWQHNATRIEIYGSKQQMIVGRHGGGWQAFTSGGEVIQQEYGRHPDPEHQQNFIDCIRDRSRPNADIEIGHKSATLIHLGNIAQRVGSAKLAFDPQTETFLSNDAANALVRRQESTEYSVPERV